MSDEHEQLDPAEALMREVGTQLRQVRLERGEELDEVAEHLRIKSTYLFGIEQGDLSRLPGRTYALGFLRSYADYLGFDGDDLITQIKSTVADLTDRTGLRIRTPLPESRLPKTPILVFSLAAIAAIYAGWSYFGRSGQLAIETVAEVPGELRSAAVDALDEERQRSPQPAPAIDAAPPPPATGLPAGAPTAGDPPPATEPSAPRPAGPASAAIPPADAAEGPNGANRPTGALAIDERGLSLVMPEAGSEPRLATLAPSSPPPSEDPARRSTDLPQSAVSADGAPAPAAAAVAALAPAAALIAAAGEVHEPGNTDAHLVVRALDSSWIRISSLGGDYLRTRTLQRGDIFLVPNRPDLELWTGNAGALELILDGAVLGPIGAAGAVVREVPLDPPSLRARFGPS